MRIAIPLISALILSACANNPVTDVVTVSGTLTERNGQFYVRASEDGSSGTRLASMPQLDYSEYLGRELSVEGANCITATAAANCLEPRKVSLVNDDRLELVYDWQQIDLEDYFF